MVQKPKAVKYKVIAGYALLFVIAVFSVWLVYTEILKLSRPRQSDAENKKIISISNTVANLYASEAIGRNAILTLKKDDFRQYNNLISTIEKDIENLKKAADTTQISKFDSIQLLLDRKKTSIAEIIKHRKRYGSQDVRYPEANNVRRASDSIERNKKPVKITKHYSFLKTADALLTPGQRDSLRKLEVSNDTFAVVYEKVLKKAGNNRTRFERELNNKELKLLEENRIISEQLRTILATVEDDILKTSYNQIQQLQSGIQKTFQNIALIGAITLFILIVFAWIIIRDLTINQNYRKQLELLNEENEELLRTKSMLMATVTHDLQTPLGSIIGFHDLLRDSGVSGKQNQYLNNIKESANYILKLVNDLLDFSRLENNRISIEKTGFNFKNVIENTCRTLEPMALNKGIELNWDVSEELNANFVSDPYRIKQVLTNLVSNAVKFTPEGSVEVTGKLEGDSIHISVIDTGIGISKEKHYHVFKEFTQAHSGIEKKFGGTGLGLTISQKILELLDGEIYLESEEGQGSIFTIVLPAIASANDRSLELPAEHRTAALPGLKGKKILIVDDDITQLSLMKEVLSAYPVDVTTEINAASVLGLLENNAFDLILTDIQMPSIDGFELIRRIRTSTDKRISSTPVIALSGKRDLSAKDFKDGGFDAHHHKPVDLQRLLLLITEILGAPMPNMAYVQNKTPEIKESEPSGALYNLKSLSQFTNNDRDSLNTILKTFIHSACENSAALQSAVKKRSNQELAEIAHKMIPMLKQMEVHSIVELLIPLEDRTHHMKWDELEVYIDDIAVRMQQLCDAFTNEMS